MKYRPVDPPRLFAVGRGEKIRLKDCARIELEPDEQVTFVTSSGTEYDVVRKTWGYYATPSLNGRLPGFGLKVALVQSGDRLYLLLVEKGKEKEFEGYLKDQGMEVLSWLSDPIEIPSGNGKRDAIRRCPLCDATGFDLVFRYDAPPKGETRFEGFDPKNYRREIWRCRLCGHFVNDCKMEPKGFYQGAYVQGTYGAEGMRAAFKRIQALPPEKSDNYHRVKRIDGYAREVWQGRLSRPTVLDVGSGLCVFLARMKEAGWECTALDPDQGAAEHARSEVGVKAICGDFMERGDLGSYDLIAFNKVLEHVADPVAMLKKSRRHLRAGGMVYVEVPDGEAAALEGPEREEFFIEHLCVFSPASLGLLAAKAGFRVRLIERLREPSGKYTLSAFLE